MREIRAAVRAWRDEPAVALASEIAAALNVLPASTLGDMFKHVDFVASNVTGSPVPMYVAGAKILRYYAFSPTLGSAFNVTLMSYVARCCVGINADVAAVPDLEVFTAAIAEGFEMVFATAPDEQSLDRSVCTSLEGVAE